MAEPRPDIHQLFCHYNSLYFSDALGTCIVSWNPGLTSVEAYCDCSEEGLCEIQLSVPMLKGCSSTDLKNILLHEMIHAFLWIHMNNEHSVHGPKFWSMANSINSNVKDDYQRPSNGYNITEHHGFQNEDNTYSPHPPKCTSSGDLMNRRMDEEPSFSNCIEKNDDDDQCRNLLCGGHTHKKPCPGRCEKVVSEFKDKGKSIGVEENEGRKHKGPSHFSKHARPKLLPAEEIKDKRVIKRPRIMSEYILPGDDKPKNSGKKSPQTDFSNSNKLLVTDLRRRSLAVGPGIPRQPRTTYRKVSNYSITEEIKDRKCEREITLVIQLFGVCTDEESEEDLHPLVNKRSERRKRMKLLNSSDGNGEQFSGLISHEIISLD